MILSLLRDSNGMVYLELAWYLSFLPGWTAGAIYSLTPIRIGQWPGDFTKEVYAQMREPGVIVYWPRKSVNFDPIPVPVKMPETETEKDKVKLKINLGKLSPQTVLVCEIVIAAGITIVIVIDGVPGDEAAIPIIWSPIIK